MLNKIIVSEDLCHGCGLCSKICPEKAISEKDIRIGEISYSNRTKDSLLFYQGKLDIGQAIASKVIRDVIHAIPYDAPVPIILDAPPGTACPVITTLESVDYTVLVTEPTPMGLHDLNAALNVAKILQKPIGIVLNKSEAKYAKIIEDYAQQENVPILLHIPFDREIAKLYSHGKILVQHSEKYKKMFESLWKSIEEALL